MFSSFCLLLRAFVMSRCAVGLKMSRLHTENFIQKCLFFLYNFTIKE